MIHKFFFLFIFFLLFNVNAIATVSEPEIKKSIFRVNVTEEITHSDLLTFQKVDSVLLQLKELYPDNSINFIVGLNSKGGDVGSAIEIGRLMRKHNATVIIAEPWNCFSSCVYLLAGATQRLVYGNVGIHRAYKLNDLSTKPADQKSFQKKIENLIKDYLNEMNISTTLYDDANRVPPEKNKILTHEELALYGLNEDDPYYHDAQISKFASRLGITSSEYIERLARKNSICVKFSSNPDKQTDCYIKIVNEGELSYQ